MAELVMIMGESGSGKTASLRNFKAGEICVLNVAGKRLPFRNDWDKHVINNARYSMIQRAVHSGQYKAYVVDDSQYLMAFEAFDRAKESGYNKFTEMAQNFYNMLIDCKTATLWERKPDKSYVMTDKPIEDTIVYFLHHIDRAEDGTVKPKTQGKMLDDKLNVAGLFTTVLQADTDGNEFYFRTKTDGASTIKSPIGMFDQAKIPNDLRAVDAIIREYYGMKGLK